MDYCNSSLIGLPASALATLKFVFRTEAMVILLKGDIMS